MVPLLAVAVSPVGSEVGKRYVGCLGCTVVGDFDLEGNGVAFVGRRITTGECLDGDESSRR